jgi:hypothetical protein
LNENTTDEIATANNIKMVSEIQKQFSQDGRLSLSLVNSYIKSLNYKHWQSVQNFIQSNNLKTHGFDIVVEGNGINIILDVKRIRESITMVNNLAELFPDYFEDELKLIESIKNKENKNISTGSKNAAGSLGIPNLITQDPAVGKLSLSENEQVEYEQFQNPAAGVIPGSGLPGASEFSGLNLNRNGAPTLPGMG